MTDQELKDLVASLARSQAETDRIVRQVTKQVGEIGNKFGRFTEGMAEPSMRKLLGERFGMTAIHPRALFRSEDKSRTLEVDVLGYDTNDRRDEVYIVEVKSLLTPEGITQTLKTIADFRELGPVALRHRPIYGVVAAVDIPQGMDQAVASRGLYLARINDDTFQLLTPPGFKPKLFVHETSKGKSNGRANGHLKKKKSRK
jgi:RecB family endonuclease NucS